ncbi:MAG: 23S rRNA (uracil(1939)-C(5))-methyltransferase RlmD [Lachnospiraceae bacterium]|nr:23S rRNA (uracil(1939)-C(5))-methyltransferase RlmD [Lachnospiraceae bacterium]
MTGSREYRKGMSVTVSITDMGENGEGIGRADGYTLFIKDALIGDVVEAEIIKALKQYGYARLVKVKEPSPDRINPPCPVSRPCGGCQIQALSYEKQLDFKQNKVRSDLIRLGGFTPEEIDAVLQPIIGMKEPWRYRNKAQVPVGMIRKNGKEELACGFYAGRTHSIIPCEDCLIGPAENKDILNAVLDYMRCEKVTAYNEEKGTGIMRHVLIRTGFRSGQIMVCLIANAKKLPEEARLVGALKDLGVTSVVQNTNRKRTNVILGDSTRVLYGPEAIEDTLLRPDGSGAVFRISARSFFQVNPRQTEKLYGKVLEYAQLSGHETVWDLYCGVGTISLFLAPYAKEVYGVEIIPEAIENARENARCNHIENAVFETGAAEQVLPDYVRRKQEEGAGSEPVDVVVVDPPRKGCDERCLQTILEVRPGRMVYVSCNPATLARDLRILSDGGYQLRAVTPVDQFAHSVHIEAVCLLERRKK